MLEMGGEVRILYYLFESGLYLDPNVKKTRKFPESSDYNYRYNYKKNYYKCMSCNYSVR